MSGLTKEGTEVFLGKDNGDFAGCCAWREISRWDLATNEMGSCTF